MGLVLESLTILEQKVFGYLSENAALLFCCNNLQGKILFFDLPNLGITVLIWRLFGYSHV